MSDKPKWMSSPDGAGVWLCEDRSGKRTVWIFNDPSEYELMDEEGDRWYPCYVIGLDEDKPNNPVCYTRDYKKVADALKRAGVFSDTRHTYEDIDALAADRDRLREDLRVETERVQRITQQRDGWHGRVERLKEECNANATLYVDLTHAVNTRCDELGIAPGDAIERVQRLANALASLRETDKQVTLESLLFDTALLCHQSESDARDFIRLANIVVDVTLSYGEASRAT